MKDENQEVRKGYFLLIKRGIQAAVKFIEVLGPETVSSLNDSLKAISEDSKWSVRLELIKSLAELAIQVQVFNLSIIESINIHKIYRTVIHTCFI